MRVCAVECIIIGYQKFLRQHSRTCSEIRDSSVEPVPELAILKMREGIHPEYRPVVFKDESTGYTFLTRSTMSSEEKIEWEDGKQYPLVKLDISSSSHPFYTGQQRLVDTAGRVERFRRRYAQQDQKGQAGKVQVVAPAAEGSPSEAETGTGGDAAAE